MKFYFANNPKRTTEFNDHQIEKMGGLDAIRRYGWEPETTDPVIAVTQEVENFIKQKQSKKLETVIEDIVIDDPNGVIPEKPKKEVKPKATRKRKTKKVIVKKSKANDNKE
jgi:hypothetical protein